LYLYCITRRSTDQITQRGRGLKTESYRVPRRLGTWAFHAWNVPRRWGQGNAKAEAIEYGMCKDHHSGVKRPKGAIMEDIHQPDGMANVWAGLCDGPRLQGSWTEVWALGSELRVCGVR
jgi:hypothetical protein